jgi:hypothetical protein
MYGATSSREIETGKAVASVTEFRKSQGENGETRGRREEPGRLPSARVGEVPLDENEHGAGHSALS